MDIVHLIIHFAVNMLSPIINIVTGIILMINQKWMLYDSVITTIVGYGVNPLVTASKTCGVHCQGSTNLTVPFAIIYLAAVWIPGILFMYSFSVKVLYQSQLVSVALAIGYKALMLVVNVFVIGKPSPLAIIHHVQTRPVIGANTVMWLYSTSKVQFAGVLLLLLLLAAGSYLFFLLVLHIPYYTTTFSNDPWFTSQTSARPKTTMKRHAGWLTMIWGFFLLIQGDAGLALMSTFMMYFFFIVRRSDIPGKITGSTDGKIPQRMQNALEIIAQSQKNKQEQQQRMVENYAKENSNKNPPAEHIDWK